MLKNINIWTLITSKTFIGALTLWGSATFHAYGQFVAGAKAVAIAEFFAATGALLSAIGLKDATSGPAN